MKDRGDDKKAKKPKKLTEQEFLDLAGKRLKREIDADDHNRQTALDDLRFLNGDQWDEKEKQRRKLRGRPCLTTNELPKYVNQVVGDMRHNRARVKVRPVDSKGDVNLAKIRTGIIANIEYLSNAEAIYDYAGEMAVSCGYGAWRVLTRYTDENPFLQEVYLERIKNPFLVYMDSAAKSEVYADAEYGFVLEKVTREEFEERFPDSEVPGDPVKVGQGVGQEVWYEKDAFFIADYYVVESEKRTLCLMKDGGTLEKSEYEEKVRAWEDGQAAKLALVQQQAAVMMQMQAVQGQQGQQGMLPPRGNQNIATNTGTVNFPGMHPQPPQPISAPPPGQQATQPPVPAPASPQAPAPDPLPLSLQVEKERDVGYPRVRWYAITADQILDGPKDIPGKFIPIILLRGPERNIEGKTHVRSLIRTAKDAQRLLNFWVTDAAEIVDMIPKAPWIGTAKQFEGYEQDYAAANAENFPFLKYNQDQGAPPPNRVPTGQPPTAVFEQIGQAKQAIKDAIGMFGSDVGDRGPELSGKAILQRQKPGDVGTFAFVDNLSRCIAHSGRVINEMIPEVYDTQRDVRIRNVDDTEIFVPVNTTTGDAIKLFQASPEQYKGMDRNKLARIIAKAGKEAKYNDLTAGKYDVVIVTGPSYATQRQEAAASLERLVQSYPQIMGIAGDLIYKFQDFMGADEIAERIESTMPEALVPAKEGKPKPQIPPKPEVQVMMAEVEVQRGKLAVEGEKVKLQAAKVQVEKLKAIKEGMMEKGELRKLILGTLAEVFGPTGTQGQGQGGAPMVPGGM